MLKQDSASVQERRTVSRQGSFRRESRYEPPLLLGQGAPQLHLELLEGRVSFVHVYGGALPRLDGAVIHNIGTTAELVSDIGPTSDLDIAGESSALSEVVCEPD